MHRIPYLRWSLLTICLIMLCYGTVLSLLPQSIFWSIDEGAKYVQMHTLLNEGQIPYLGQRLDPDYHFYPQTQVFPQPQPDSSPEFHWAIWFPLLSIAPYQLFGVTGIYLIPLLSGIGIAIMSGWLVHHSMPKLAPITILIVALASPIFFYSVLFWEHTLAVLLGLGSLAVASKLQNVQSIPTLLIKIITICGFLIAAILLRFEMIIFAFALILAAGIAAVWHIPSISNRVRQSGCKLIVCGAIILFLLFFCLVTIPTDQLVETNLINPRYGLLIETGQRYATNLDFWRALPQHVQAVWINAQGKIGADVPSGVMWLGSLSLLISIFAAWGSPSNRGWAITLSGLLMGAISFYTLLLPERYGTLHSFFLPTPYLIFVLSIVPYLFHTKRFSTTMLGLTTLGYLIFGSLGVALRQAGILANLEWGTRYLLLLYPIATVCTIIGIGHLYYHLTTRWQKYAIGFVCGGLCLLGVGFEFRGLQEVYQTKLNFQPYAQAFEVVDQPLVTDLVWFPARLATHFVEQEIYTLPQQQELHHWLSQVEGQTNAFVYAGFFHLDPNFLAISPVPIEAKGSEQVYGITFTLYEIGGDGE